MELITNFPVALLFKYKSRNEQEGQHPLTGQRTPPISGGT